MLFTQKTPSLRDFSGGRPKKGPTKQKLCVYALGALFAATIFGGNLPVFAQDNNIDAQNSCGNPTSSQHANVEAYRNLTGCYSSSGHKLPHADSSEGGDNGGGHQINSPGKACSVKVQINHMEPHPMNPIAPPIRKQRSSGDLTNIWVLRVGSPTQLFQRQR